MFGLNPEDLVEVSYANGELYKRCFQTSIGNNSVSSERIDDGCVSRYYASKSPALDKLDKNFPFYSKKEYKEGNLKIKYYVPSNDIYKLIEGSDSKNGTDLTKYDLCPDVDLWVGVGLYREDESSYDLIFSVNNDEQLTRISEYYNLVNPLPKDLTMNDQPNLWKSEEMEIFANKVNKNFNGSIKYNFKYGSVKFENKRPKLIKMYGSNYKDNYA